MSILYHHANSMNRLVIGTSNRSELLVGYFTKYGDGASDLIPIGDLYKTQVWEISQELGIPNEIIKKAPTAGLQENQTDEEELGIDYITLDKLLYGLLTVLVFPWTVFNIEIPSGTSFSFISSLCCGSELFFCVLVSLPV